MTYVSVDDDTTALTVQQVPRRQKDVAITRARAFYMLNGRNACSRKRGSDFLAANDEFGELRPDLLRHRQRKFRYTRKEL